MTRKPVGKGMAPRGAAAKGAAGSVPRAPDRQPTHTIDEASRARPQPKGRLRQLATAYFEYEDEAGNRFFRRATVQRQKAGGAPKKTLRDIALTLHVEYLTIFLKQKKGVAYETAAEMFGLEDPEKNIGKIIKKTRSEPLHGFMKVAVIDGLPNNAGAQIGRMLAAFSPIDSAAGRLEGYAVIFGQCEARWLVFGRGRLPT